MSTAVTSSPASVARMIRPLQKKDFDEAFKRIRVDTEKLKKLVTRFKEFGESN